MDWYWTRSWIRSSVPSGKKTKHSSLAWTITSRRRWVIEFWRLKDDLQNKFEHSQHWSDDMWKSTMAGGGGNKKRFQNCTDPSGQEILYLRALQSHSGRNPIDPSRQDNVLIPNNFFEYIYHVGCAVSLHSTTNSGIDSGRTKFKQGLTDGILYSRESHEKGPRGSARAWFDQTTSCIVQAEVEKDTKIRSIGSIYSLLKVKDWSSIKQDVTQSSLTIHSQLIVSRK